MTNKYDSFEIMADLVKELSALNANLNKGSDIASPTAGIQFIPDTVLPKGARTDAYIRNVNTIKMISDELKKFGIHIGTNGYAYILDAVIIIAERNSLDVVLNKDVYPVLAYRYRSASPGIIEHNIRNAIKTAYMDNENQPGVNKMGCFRKRPTNKEFLLYLTELVWNRTNEPYSVIAS